MNIYGIIRFNIFDLMIQFWQSKTIEPPNTRRNLNAYTPRKRH